ncbi:MAG TPA: ATP-binding cassette domain-containing protein [Candidatus Latescibacteria bacterium]|nr:ATP-binding cassette domain-containing protein [Candidatus Latescibacterota bacterium]
MREILKDSGTVFWKERREVFAPGRRRSFLVQTSLLVLLFGSLVPYLQGPYWISGSYPLVLHFLLVPFVAVLPYVADAFAGEKERRTIESLLATRISEGGVFLGKFLGVWFVAYVQALAVIVVGWATLNIYNYAELHLPMPFLYPGPITFLLLVGSACSTALSTGLGALISLRSETVRGAQQASGVLLLGLSLSLMFGIYHLTGPSSLGWKVALGFTSAVGTAAFVAVLAGIALFDRERLVLGRCDPPGSRRRGGSPSGSQDVIEVRGLTRKFGETIGVKDLSFSVHRGEIFGLLGPNGAGKTTTIRLLLGIISPSDGEARVLGRDVEDGGFRRKVGVLLEDDGLYERLTAEENLEYYARIYGVEDERKSRIEELLEGTGLSNRVEEPISRWSRGMKRTLAFVRALVHGPELLFLDEPTAGLDPIGAKRVREVLRNVAEGGNTIFLTTHNLKEAEVLCSRVGVLHRGRLLAVGAPQEISGGCRVKICCEDVDGRTSPALLGLPFVSKVEVRGKELRVSLSEASRVPDLVKSLVDAGVRIYEVSTEGSLEEAFVDIVKDAEEV